MFFKFVVVIFCLCFLEMAHAAGGADLFSPPDELSIIGASVHGKDKYGYKFNGIHPGIGVSGGMRGDSTLRWQAGYISKDSYGCQMYYGGGSWFPFASGNKDDFVLFGLSLVIASKCLSPDDKKHLVVLPLPTFRLFPSHHFGLEGVFSPKIRGDMVWFVALQFRHEY